LSLSHSKLSSPQPQLPAGLQELNLSLCDLSECSFDFFQELVNLQSLNLEGTKLGDSTLEVLRGCSSLRKINVQDVERCLEPLARLPALETLSCNDESDVHVFPDRAWPRLRSLSLCGTASTLGVLTLVSKIKTLKHVEYIEDKCHACEYLAGNIFIDGRFLFTAHF